MAAMPLDERLHMSTGYATARRQLPERISPCGVGCLERRGLGGKSARIGGKPAWTILQPARIIGKLAWAISQSAQVAEKLIAIR